MFLDRVLHIGMLQVPAHDCRSWLRDVAGDQSEVTESAVSGFSWERGQLQITFPGFKDEFDVAVATHKTIDLVIHTQVYKLKRNRGK
jgi:hypothetical protein